MRSPKWKCKMRTEIPKSREEASEEVRNDESDIKIYTDGSGQQGRIGAAAVMTHGFRPAKEARYYLGPETKHTVFEGECIGQILALRLLQQSGINLNGTAVMIATDNQATILAHRGRKQQPGSYLINEADRMLRCIKKKWPTVDITLRWVPGHEGVEGNEKADKEAKMAAEGEHKNKRAGFGLLAKGLPASKSATLQRYKEQAKTRSQRDFREGTRYERVSKFDPQAPSAEFRRTSKTLTRAETSIIAQLRIGHIPLMSYLHRFKLAESPLCPKCGDEPETVTHYLKICEGYKEPRRALKRELGRDLEIGLELLREKKHIKAVLRFIRRTGRFEETHKNLGENGDG